MKYESLNGTSDKAVCNATSKHWDDWVSILDYAKMQTVAHKEIAEWLWEQYGDKKGLKEKVLNGWWCQQVTVGYEYAHNRRVTGETIDAGFQVGVQKTIPTNYKVLWQYVVGDGLSTWLGKVDEIRLQKGFYYKTNSGVEGEIRSVDMYKRIRMSIVELGQHRSTLQLYFFPIGSKKTSLRFHQEKLRDAHERAKRKDHWKKVLEIISNNITQIYV